jgi:hypothetical protein
MPVATIPRVPNEHDMVEGAYFTGAGPGADGTVTLFSFAFRTGSGSASVWFFDDARADYGESIPVPFTWRDVRLKLRLLERPPSPTA